MAAYDSSEGGDTLPLPDDAAVSAAIATVEALKARGNAAFEAGDFAGSIHVYAEALSHDAARVLRRVASRSSAAALLSRLHANKSAAHAARGEGEAALADARSAASFNPSWTKAHMRVGAAATLCGRPRDAYLAYVRALALEPGNTELTRLRDAADTEAGKIEQTSAIESVAAFADAFKYTRSLRLRLATLATFWNLTETDSRWLIFSRFLVLIAGPSSVAPVPEGVAPESMPGPHISRFDRGLLVSLPMHNYVDVVVPEPWTRFYAALPSSDKVAVFEASWADCSPAEQNLILADVRAFFTPAPPARSDADEDAATTDANVPAAAAAASAAAPVVSAAPTLRRFSEQEEQEPELTSSGTFPRRDSSQPKASTSHE